MKNKRWCTFIAVAAVFCCTGAVHAQEVNYAEALQKSLYFYDAEKSGPGITGGRLTWRGDSEVVDVTLPLNEEMTNMSQSFIDENRQVLDPDGDGTVNVSGGYHDAGDHVKFGLPQTYSSATLEWALFEFKEAFVEIGQYDHMMELLRWFSDYYLRSTFRDSGGGVVAFCYQVGEGNIDHNFWGPPEIIDHETYPRPAYFATAQAPASDQAAGAAASLALTYLNRRETESDYALLCLDTAKALYTFAKSNRGLGYSGGFYNSSYDEDELSWAAVWLNIATGDSAYIEDIISQDSEGRYTGWLAKIINSAEDDWQNIWVHCWDTKWGGVFAKLAPITDEERDWEIFRWNLEYWSGVEHQNSSDGSYLAKTPAGFSYISTWGSARYNAAAQFQGMIYKKYTGSTLFDDWMTRQIQYIMGDNPLNRSYIVGYSDNYASHPHHRASHGSATNSMFDPPAHKHILWGALVGGPGPEDEHVDATEDYIYNEVAIDYNAGLVGALAGFLTYFGQDQQPLENFPPDDPALVEFNVEAKIEQVNSERSQLTIRVTNESAFPPRIEIPIKVRYFFDISELIDNGQDISDVSFAAFYDQNAVNSDPVTAVGPLPWDADNHIYYMEFIWPESGFYGTREYQFGLIAAQASDYTAHWDPGNDPSYQGLTGDYTETRYISLYVEGELFSGTEPSGEPATNDDGEETEDDTDNGDEAEDGTDEDALIQFDVAYAVNAWDTGFTANVTITNNGASPIEGWTLTWTFADGQQITGSWNADVSQSGAQVTASNDAGHWNGAIAANGGTVSFGFQATHSGANSIPVDFKLNGAALNESSDDGGDAEGGGDTDAAAEEDAVDDADSDSTDTGAAVEEDSDDSQAGLCQVSYSTNDWDTGFTAEVTVSNNDTSPMEGWTLTWTFADGQQITGSWNADVSQSGAQVTASNDAGHWNGTIAADGGTVSFGFQGTHSGVDSIPSDFELNGVACNGGADTGDDSDTDDGSDDAADQTDDDGTDSGDGSVTGDHVDNPFANADGYINPDYAAKVLEEASLEGGTLGEQMSRVADYSTAVWMDRIAAVEGGSDAMGLRDHLDEALQQQNGDTPLTIMVVIYDLPNRDCAALASNGELRIAEDGLNIYKTDYIDPIVEILSDSKYSSLRIVAVVEPDSLPNLITNLDMADCAEANSTGAYVEGIQYAIDSLHPLPNVYLYLDIAHSGWLGWDSNFNPAVQLYTNMLQGTQYGFNSIDGFITNTANYTPIDEVNLPDPDLNVGGQQIKSADFYEWNPHFDELDYAAALRSAFIRAGLPSTTGMLIDTSRNGWGGGERPDSVSISTDLNTYVDESRVDRRPHRGGWCNQSGAGIGARPQADPQAGIDAYVWVKPPGESDGVSTDGVIDPDDPSKQFDAMCDPDAQNRYNTAYPTNALPDAPHAGRWFSDQFRMLVENAYPSL